MLLKEQSIIVLEVSQSVNTLTKHSRKKQCIEYSDPENMSGRAVSKTRNKIIGGRKVFETTASKQKFENGFEDLHPLDNATSRQITLPISAKPWGS